jgi:hypothetical protein
MKELSIEEGNKIIAEWMGEEVIWHEEKWQWKSRHNGIKPFMYDHLWDWLMPVVEKIERMRYHTQIFYLHYLKAHACQISKGKDFAKPFDDAEWSGSSLNSKIEAVWQAVVFFIQWHNQNKHP